MRDRQTIVAPLKEGKTVIMVANSLLNSKQLDISVTGQQIKLKSRLIEDVENIMEPRDWRQEGSIWTQILTGEAGQQMQILRRIGSQGLGEAGGHLSKVSIVPGRLMTIKWWHDEDLECEIKKEIEVRTTLWNVDGPLSPDFLLSPVSQRQVT